MIENILIFHIKFRVISMNMKHQNYRNLLFIAAVWMWYYALFT